ncbi:MAG: SDR family oxidoreductase [Pseudomonadota bacterium]
MKVLVLGASGMLGSAIFKELFACPRTDLLGTVSTSQRKTYFPPSMHDALHDGIAVEALDDCSRLIERFQPDVLINCIGIVKQRSEGQNLEKSSVINTFAPRFLAHTCATRGIRFIHFSTDCVFDGVTGNYRETDPCSPTDIYGITKMCGETVDGGALTLRTSIVGPELYGRLGLFEWFKAQTEAVQGYRNVHFSGVPTAYLAKIVKQVLYDFPDLAGLYHVASERISKYELLQIFSDVCASGIAIHPSETPVLDRSLNADKFSDATGIFPAPWRELSSYLRPEVFVE